MTKFAKGESFRLISLDGKLHETTYIVHDSWGDDTHPRNRSFMYGHSEHFTHTDLMRRPDDTSPVVVPDGGVWYIALGSNMGWGRSQSIEGAIKSMKRQGGKVKAYVVHQVSKWTQVDGMGALSWPQGISPVEVKRYESKPKAGSK